MCIMVQGWTALKIKQSSREGGKCATDISSQCGMEEKEEKEDEVLMKPAGPGPDRQRRGED